MIQISLQIMNYASDRKYVSRDKKGSLLEYIL